MFSWVPQVLYIISRLKAPPKGMSLVINSYLFFGLLGTSLSLEIGSNPALTILISNFLTTCFNSNKYLCDSAQTSWIFVNLSPDNSIWFPGSRVIFFPSLWRPTIFLSSKTGFQPNSIKFKNISFILE